MTNAVVWALVHNLFVPFLILQLYLPVELKLLENNSALHDIFHAILPLHCLLLLTTFASVPDQYMPDLKLQGLLKQGNQYHLKGIVHPPHATTYLKPEYHNHKKQLWLLSPLQTTYGLVPIFFLLHMNPQLMNQLHIWLSLLQYDHPLIS